MYALSKPSPLTTLEGRIVSRTYLYSALSAKSNIFSPHSNATTLRSSSSGRETPPIYHRSLTGGAAVVKRQPISVAHMASSNVGDTDDRISRISSTIRVIPDFPKPGERWNFLISNFPFFFECMEYVTELEYIFCGKKMKGLCFRI